ncbi:MAG: RagB/SusD family nutrient uptake outer membrane protein [Allomuricauda sp.]
MKKVFFILSILMVSGLLVLSCSKFLEEDPKAVLSTENFFLSESDAISAVSAVYDKLNKRHLTNATAWIYADITTPDTSTPSAELDIAVYDNFTLGTSNPYLNENWPELYEGIARANYAIVNLTEMEDIDNALRERLINETKFLRGWFYFFLVKAYGGVPLITEPININDESQYLVPRSSKEEVYAQIEADFTAAEALPATYDGADVGRVTSGAAKAFLAKAYLFQEKWQLAADKAQEVVDSGVYQLMPSFRDATWNKNTPESIFEMQSIGGTPGWEDENEGNSVGIWARPPCFGGWGLHYGTQDLYDAFEDGDPRKSYTLLDVGEEYDGQVLPSGCLPENTYGLLKLLGDPAEGTGGDANASQNFIFMRLSEVYLMIAEANAMLNNLGPAEDALEVVRARARNDVNADAGSLPELSGLSQPALIDAIRDERRVELASEMKRFYDLVRWGIAGEVIRADGKNFVDGKHELFPIPQSQIDVSQGTLSQNPGY